MNLSRFTFLFAVFLTFFAFPENVEAQIPQWDQIDFSENEDISVVVKTDSILITEEKLTDRVRRSIWFNSQFETGKGFATERMRGLAEGNRNMYRMRIARADAVMFEGFNDSQKNRQSNNRPLAESNVPERYQTSDARLSEIRAMVGRDLSLAMLSKGFNMNNVGNYIPSKVEVSAFSLPDSIQAMTREKLGDLLYLKSQRSFRIVMVNYHDNSSLTLAKKHARLIEDLRKEMEKLHSRVDSVAGAVAYNDSDIDNLDDRVDSLETESNTDLEEKILALMRKHVDVFAGGGAEHFTGLLTPTYEYGLRIGPVSLSRWRGTQTNIGSVMLPVDGEVALNRASSGSNLSVYPFNHKLSSKPLVELEYGPSAGILHAEDIIKGRERYIRAYDAYLAGAVANLSLGPASLHTGVFYQLDREFESNGEFQPHGTEWRAEFGVRIHLWDAVSRIF